MGNNSFIINLIFPEPFVSNILITSIFLKKSTLAQLEHVLILHRIHVDVFFFNVSHS